VEIFQLPIELWVIALILLSFIGAGHLYHLIYMEWFYQAPYDAAAKHAIVAESFLKDKIEEQAAYIQKLEKDLEGYQKIVFESLR
jgi:hypothetical protein